MKNITKLCLLFLFVFSAEAETALTIYSSADPASFDPQSFIAQNKNGNVPNYLNVPGYGVVKEVRELDIAAGVSVLKFNDVASYIDPTTVTFKDLTFEDTKLLEQFFKFDLLSPEKIYERYLDKNISLQMQKGDKLEEITGTLLSYNSGKFILKTAEGISIFSYSPEIKLGELPGGLITKPTLEWKLRSPSAGKHKIKTTYQTNGMTWRADYNLLINKDENLSDINAWVTIMNLSGKSYEDSGLKLVAGDVQRVQPQRAQYDRVGAMYAKAQSLEADAGFEEKSFFEYHLYTLPGKTSIPDNATQQLPLFPAARNVNTEKILVYYGVPQNYYNGYLSNPVLDRDFGNQSNKKVDVYLQFKNKKENQLGIPFPAGKIRVYKQDEADGSTEFIGEDLIDHTPKNENIMVKLGSSFDVVGERRQVDFAVNDAQKFITETIEVELRNNKDTAQKVIIKENLYRWLNWKILSASSEYEKADSRTIHVPLEIPANDKRTFRYQVRYSW